MSKKDPSLNLYKLTQGDQSVKVKKQLKDWENKKNIIVKYLSEKESTPSDCVQLTWDLYDSLKMSVTETFFFLRNLEGRGVVEFVDGKYVLRKG